jgi:hypothetical protein
LCSIRFFKGGKECGKHDLEDIKAMVSTRK